MCIALFRGLFILLPDAEIDEKQLWESSVVNLHLWQLEEETSYISKAHMLPATSIILQVAVFELFLIFFISGAAA